MPHWRLMWNWIGSVAVGVLSGAGSSILTIWLSARLQHHYWGRQQLAELSLTTIHEIEKLCAVFIICTQRHDKRELPEDFNYRLEIARSQLKVLFSKKAPAPYEELQSLILKGTGKEYGPHDFDNMRETLLRVLYAEIGIIP